MRGDGGRLGGEDLVARDGGAGLAVVHGDHVAGVDHRAVEDLTGAGPHDEGRVLGADDGVGVDRVGDQVIDVPAGEAGQVGAEPRALRRGRRGTCRRC